MNDAHEPDIEFDPDSEGDVFRVVAGGWVKLVRFDCSIYIIEGTATDLASVPWYARWSVSRTALGVRAPLVHDELYRTAGRGLITAPAGRTFTRRESDSVLYDLALEDGRSRHTVSKAYAAVRMGGWWSWHRVGSRLAFWR